MEYYQLPQTDLNVSKIGLGCMRIGDKTVEQVEELIKESLDTGINFFDHADIYAGGKSETLFGEALKRNPKLRSQMIIQSKCGIKPGVSYESTKDYIVESTKGILERLQCDYLDILLIHRPDALMDPAEVGEAFDYLYNEGLVHYFGVSNMNPLQIELIKKYTKQPIIIDQLQFSPAHASMIDEGIHVNMNDKYAVNRDGGILNYTRLNDMTIQCWSIIREDLSVGSFIDNEDYPELNAILKELADKYNVTKGAIVAAWILRHPAHMMPIIGTTSPVHMKEMAAGADIHLSHDEWYKIYLYNKPLP